MTERRDRFTAARDKQKAVEKAENNCTIADSMDVRRKLMEQVKSGETTLKQVQSKLGAIKRKHER